MSKKVFLITGNKIASLYLSEQSLMFSGQKLTSVDEFKKSWDKKSLFTTKSEIKYEDINYVKKEENDKDIRVERKIYLRIPMNCEFSFLDENDYEIFFSFLTNEKFFSRKQETLTPFNAISKKILGLIAVIAITVFSYFQAIKIANGTLREATSGKERLFNALVGLLRDKGVLVVGIMGGLYFLYEIWNRFSKPPNEIVLLPFNS